MFLASPGGERNKLIGIFSLKDVKITMIANQRLLQGIKLYLAGALVYGLGILTIQILPYYQTALHPKTQQILFLLYLAYLLFSPFVYYFSGKMTAEATNKPFLVLRGLKHLWTKQLFQKEEQVAMLFMGVKLFFLPIMINFFFDNLHSFRDNIGLFPSYPFLLSSIFLVDTFIFSLGYAIELPSLKNVVKSVEPTFFGWFVTLICYPPFNGWTGNIIPWGANDYASFGNLLLTQTMHIVIIILFGIYLWATLALGLKSSNLTNRGIVNKFPYSLVRHPAYISKNTIWWLTLLPIINWKFALGMFFWSLIYYFRAITEERHLSQDPEYLKYCEKVRWRFVPGIL